MTNDEKLLQQALDALESDCGATKFGALEALRARLAQPEPVLVSPKEFIAAVTGKWDISGIPALMSVWPTPEEAQPEPEHRDVVIAGDLWRVEFLPDNDANVRLVKANYTTKQEKQEPVAWMHDSHVGFNVPLYTAPPQREWQGLTDEEIHSTNGYEEDRKLYHFVRAIEAKLREKNA